MRDETIPSGPLNPLRFKGNERLIFKSCYTTSGNSTSLPEMRSRNKDVGHWFHKPCYARKEGFMPERLVDIERQGLELLHTFPVTVSPPSDDDEAFKQKKALEAAGHASWSERGTRENLNAKMHVSGGGQLTPYGDPLGVLAETKAGLDQFVRDRAYFLGEQAGRPEGRADDFWHQRSIIASANALTRCGSERAVRKARRTSTGIGRAPLRRAEASVTKIEELAPPRVRS